MYCFFLYKTLLFFLSMCRFSLAIDMLQFVEDLHLLRAPATLNLQHTFFSTLDGHHVNGKVATVTTYPWAAKVVYSRTRDIPYMCTAICVYDGVFMTAARCIINLKVKYVSVVYKAQRLPVKAIVVPSKPTSQQFDDIGFLVIETKAGTVYSPATLYPATQVQRKDPQFKWFTTKTFTGAFKAVGYVANKGVPNLANPEMVPGLKELPIFIGVDFCTNIVTNKGLIDGFTVPCYHSCTLADFNKKTKAKACEGYLGVEGAAVMHVQSKKILGVAIWGPKFSKYELPVGFSIVNSAVFQDDFNCAKKIRASNAKSGFQSICKK